MSELAEHIARVESLREKYRAFGVERVLQAAREAEAGDDGDAKAHWLAVLEKLV